MISLPTYDDVAAASERLAGHAHRTPVLRSSTADARWGAQFFFKCENFQRMGAFKFRGAFNALSRFDAAQRKAGALAFSSGNHAQAVALAARMFGARAVVVMPTTVTQAKRAGAERLGARIELAGTTTAHRMDRAMEIVRDEGMTLVPPYDHPVIIAGQGTAGLEIAEDLPDVGTVLVPVGGGGLSAGVATAIKLTVPGARVIGVEPAGAPKLSRARAAGKPVKLDATSGLADGLLAVEVGSAPFAHHQAYIDEVVTIPDEALREAMRFLLDRMKLVTEPSGAITVAALLTGAVRTQGSVVALLSGGNIEYAGLRSLLGDA